MNFIILHSPHTDEDNFLRWRIVGYAKKLPREHGIRRPRVNFYRGDLFVVIPAEYASNIMEGILWAGIALDDRTILDGGVVLEVMKAYALGHGLMRAIYSALSSRGALQLILMWAAKLSPLVVLHATAQQGLRELWAWWGTGQGTHELQERAKEIKIEIQYKQDSARNAFSYGIAFALEGAASPKTSVVDLLDALNKMNLVPYHMSIQQRNEIQREMNSWTQRAFPMRTVILAMLESKKIDALDVEEE